jgi:hypothetical protein
MTPETLLIAIEEATRFLKAAKEARKSIVHKPWGADFEGNKSTAAAKRASMDLTRALADMRRPPR